MGVVSLKSLMITDRDSSPMVKAGGSQGGVLKEMVGTLETNADDSSASVYRMVQVPSNCRVSQVLLYTDDLGTTGTMDIGIYQTTQNGGAEVDADHFASAVDVNAAALNAVDVTHESGVFGLEDAEKPLWEALGLSSDPGIMYDVCVTLRAAITAAGTVTLKARYAQ